MFWMDKWLYGKRVSDLAPRLFGLIPKRFINKRTVQDALSNRRWILDIKGALTVGALIDYLHLWEALSDISLQPNIEDKHIFSFASDGRYSAKVAYKSFPGIKLLWTLQKGVEILGPIKMSILHLAGCPKQVMEDGQTG